MKWGSRPRERRHPQSRRPREPVQGRRRRTARTDPACQGAEPAHRVGRLPRRAMRSTTDSRRAVPTPRTPPGRRVAARAVFPGLPPSDRPPASAPLGTGLCRTMRRAHRCAPCPARARPHCAARDVALALRRSPSSRAPRLTARRARRLRRSRRRRYRHRLGRNRVRALRRRVADRRRRAWQRRRPHRGLRRILRAHSKMGPPRTRSRVAHWCSLWPCSQIRRPRRHSASVKPTNEALPGYAAGEGLCGGKAIQLFVNRSLTGSEEAWPTPWWKRQPGIAVGAGFA